MARGGSARKVMRAENNWAGRLPRPGQGARRVGSEFVTRLRVGAVDDSPAKTGGGRRRANATGPLVYLQCGSGRARRPGMPLQPSGLITEPCSPGWPRWRARTD
jgi:hypothetical protein